MKNLRTSEREGRRPARSLLVALMAVLVSLFAVGCGSSSGDFVAAGNGGSAPQPPLAQTGSVTFQLTKAQAATVPQATQFVLVEFFNRANVAVYLPVPRAFGTGTITIDGVPLTASQARITALDANNNPIAILIATFSVVPGGDVQATIGAPSLVTFDISASPDPASVAVNATTQLNLDVIFNDGTEFLPPVPASSVTGATFNFTSENPAVAKVTAGGSVTGVTVGNTTVNVSFTLYGVTKTDSVVVNVTSGVTPPPDPGAPRLEVAPSSVTLTNTSVSKAIVATYFPANATTGQVVTAQTTATNAPTGITYSAGTITSTAIQNTTTNLTISFTPTGESPVNATVAVTVSRLPSGTTPGTPARLVLSQPNLVVDSTTPTNGVVTATYFPANSTVGTTLGFNTLTGVPKNAVPTGTENRWTFNSALNTIAPTGTGGTAATNSTVVFTMTHTPTGGTAVSADLNVTAVAAGDPRLMAITSSQLIGATSLNLPTGTRYPFVVVNTRGNGMQFVAPAGTAAVGDVSIDPASASNIGAFSTVAGPPAANDLTAAAVPASGSVLLRRVVTTAPSLTFTPVATVNVNVTNTTLLGGGAPNVVLTPSANSVKSGATLPFKIEWLFQDNTRLDVTPFYNLVTAGAITFGLDATSGLSPGFITGNTVAVNTPGIFNAGGIINAVIGLPTGAPVLGPAANINVTP